MKIRGSKADINMACAGSLVPARSAYNPRTDDANEGRANHKALEFVARGEEPPIEQISERYGVDEDDLAITARSGSKLWLEVSRWFPDVATEIKIEGPVTRGTIDVICVEPDALAIADWKTGRSGDEHKYQRMAYADAAREIFGIPSRGFIPTFELYTALGEIQCVNLTEEMLDGFREQCREQIKSALSDHPQYAPGAHCKFCPRQNECAALEDYNRTSASSLIETGSTALTRDDVGRLYDRYKLLKDAIVKYENMLDSVLEDGSIDIGNGRVVQLKDEKRETIEASNDVLDVLASFAIDDASLLLGESLPKSAIKRACKAISAKGKASALERSIMKELRESGFVTKKTIKKKEIVRT
jgi:hypothetical protein